MSLLDPIDMRPLTIGYPVSCCSSASLNFMGVQSSECTHLGGVWARGLGGPESLPGRLAPPVSRRFGARMPSPDTIFALSSGRLPAAIAVVRISGPRAGDALMALAGK